MYKLVTFLALSILAAGSLRASDAEFSLEAGNYLLVYQIGEPAGMKHLRVSFARNADGILTVTCADPAYVPVAATQAQATFQFGLVNAGHRDEQRGTESPYEALYFVGHPKLVFTEKNQYQREAGVCVGTAAGIMAGVQPQSGVNPAGSGTFLLYKLP